MNKLLCGLAFGFLANLLIALTPLTLPGPIGDYAVSKALAGNYNCENPPYDEPDADGDECTNYTPDKPKNNGPDCPSCGDPVNFETGNLYESVVDFRGFGQFPLILRRTYESMDSGKILGFGAGWHGPYSRSITLTSSTVAKVIRDDGRVFTFTLSGGTWSTDPDVNAKLVQSANGWVYTTAKDATETYDANGHLLRVVNRAGYTQSLTYDTNGNLASVTGPYGRRLQFTYAKAASGGNWLVSQVTVPDGGIYAYAYDAQDNLVSITYPDNTVRQYVYEDTALPHALTGIVDANGARYATFAFDSDGRAASTHLAGGANSFHFNYAYMSLGYVEVTHPLGSVDQYYLEALHGTAHPDVLTRTCPGCASTAGQQVRNYYDANGNLGRHTDFNGNTTTYTYDLTRNLETARTEAAGTAQARTITTTWDPHFRLPDEIDEPGRTTTFSYDAHGRVVSETLADTASGATRSWRYSYAPDAGGVPGQLASVTDSLGNTTHYSYDAQGNLTSVTNALGQVTRVSAYDSDGRPLTIVDPNGVTTSLTYDARGRLVSRQVNNRTTQYSYDAAGNLTQVTLPDGVALSYSYDAAHRLIGITDGLGNRIVYTLDAAGHRTRTQVYGAGGTLTKTSSSVYDALNRLYRSLGSQSQTTTYSYDGNGNVTAVTDPLGHTARYGYDALNRATQNTDALGGATRYGYDALGRLLSVTDPRGLNTGYQYDAFGARTQRVSPDSGTTTYTYDAAGNLAARTDAKGNTVTYTYDALNRPTHIHYSADSSQDVTLSYDDPNAGFGIGRLTGMTDASGSTRYDYTFTGKLADETQTIGGQSYTVRYRYDSADRLVGITYPSGRVISYILDASGRIDGVNTILGGITTSLASNITYAPFGGVAQLTYGNGLTLNRQYDTDYRLTNIDVGSLFSRSYGYLANNDISGTTDAGGNALQLGYDALDRLTSAQDTTRNLGWSYDATGNRVSATNGSVTTDYTTAPASNQLTQLADTSGITQLAYDPNGNLIAEGGKTFVYNAANRLAEVDSGGAVLGSYTYDALGQRVGKTVGGKSTDYVYDRHGHLIAEIDGSSGQTLNEYVYLNGVPLAMSAGKPNVYRLTGTDRHSGRTATLEVDLTTHHIRLTEAGQVTFETTVTARGWHERWIRERERDRDESKAEKGPVRQINLHVRLPDQSQLEAHLRIDSAHKARGSLEVQDMLPKATGEGGEYADANAWDRPERDHERDRDERRVLESHYRLQGANELALYYIHTDHLGTPQMLTDAQGQVAWQATYSPFGQAIVVTSQVTFNLRFPGQYYDAETGLQYNYFRYYDPNTGRYVSSDPIGIKGGLNTYAYVGENPLEYIDLWGLYSAVTATLPNGSTYIPMTTVKNSAQAKSYGLPVGTRTAIAVPPGVNPQTMVNEWRHKFFNGPAVFAWAWRPGGPNDYKLIDPMYDAYGNFEYGATGAAAGSGYSCQGLTRVGDWLHGGHNNPINTTDIQSGYSAISNGGKLGITNYNPPKAAP